METASSPTFATLLRRSRQAAGLTQEELAERACLSVRTIGDLERGVSQAPRKDTVELLAQALALAAPERAALAEAARRLSTAVSPALPPPAHPLLRSSATPASWRCWSATSGARARRCCCSRASPASASPACWPRPPHARKAGACCRAGVSGAAARSPSPPCWAALQGNLQGRAPAPLRAVLHDCAWLVRLLPELLQAVSAPFPAWTLPPEQERRLMFAAVGRFLANVAGPAGTLLVLDDLQWAGTDALELLAGLLHAPAQIPLRVLGAYRSTEVGPQAPLAVALADLAHAGLAAQLTLGPLVGAEAECLLDTLLAEVEPVHARLRAQLLQRAGGVPFFAISCVRALRPGLQQAAAEAVPWDLQHSIRQRAALLTAEAQEVLGVAAVVGRRVPPGLLVAVAARPEEDVLAALEAAARAQLLVEEEDAAAYQFAHDVIREVLEADVGVARRAVLHRRVAEALEALPGAPPVERLAYHYSRSEAHEKAALYFERAGDRAAAQHAHTAAEGYYRELVERLKRLGRALEAAQAREKLGHVLRTVARYDEALAVLEQAAEAYRAAADREGAHRALAQIGQVHGARGTPEDGVRRLRAALEAVGTHEPSHGLAELYAALAHLYYASGRTEEQLAAAERAAELARVVGDNRILADAENRRGLALDLLGRLEEAQQVLEEAVPLAEAVGDLGTLARVLTNLAGIYNVRGESERGRRCAERTLEVAERRGDAAGAVFAAGSLANIHIFAGEWVQARTHLERALARGRAIGAPRVVASPLAGLGRLCLAEGAWDEAARYLEVVRSAAEGGATIWQRLAADALLAEREILEGHADAACARLAPLLAGAGHDVWGGLYAQATLAWAHLEMGRVAAAAEVVGQTVARARATGNWHALVDGLRVQAMVATRQGRREDAERALKEGLSLARSLPYPYAEGRLLHVYGAMHAQKGEPGPARERLEAALAIFRRLGARKDAERVEQIIADRQQT